MLGVLVGAGVLGTSPVAVRAQAAVPRIRPLGPIVRVSKDSLAYIEQIRVLSDGRVLANDTRARRVVLFDSTLGSFLVVADTTSQTTKAYGARGGSLFPFLGDSSLFADYASLSFLVIDPGGKIARVMAAPRGSDGGLSYLSDAEVDPRGYVISQQSRGFRGGAGGGGAGGGGGGAFSRPPKSEQAVSARHSSAMAPQRAVKILMDGDYDPCARVPDCRQCATAIPVGSAVRCRSGGGPGSACRAVPRPRGCR